MDLPLAQLRLGEDDRTSEHGVEEDNVLRTLPVAEYPKEETTTSSESASSETPARPIKARTIYLGGVPKETEVQEILNHIHVGPLESVKALPDRGCVFISFLDTPTADRFLGQITKEPLVIHGQELRPGYGKPLAVSPHILQAIASLDASRNVILGNLTEHQARLTEIEAVVTKFGPLDLVTVDRERGTASVHFCSISSAIKCIGYLTLDYGWSDVKVGYGRDRCEDKGVDDAGDSGGPPYVAQSPVWLATPHRQTGHGSPYPGSPFATPFTPHGMSNGFASDVFEDGSQLISPMPYASPVMSNFSPMHSPMMLAAAAAAAASAVASAAGSPHHPSTSLGNRTVYLGNIHAETTTEELCNAIRGGILHSIRYLPEKHIAFVTFCDALSAANFFNLATFQGIVIHNRRLKVGWGKHSGPLPPAIASAVQNGVTRNIYIGNVNDAEFDEERLRADFAEYGEIELVNSLPAKNCSFVNFCHIQSAIKAIEGIVTKPEYRTLKIANGKDRCANPPRGLNGTTATLMSMSPLLGMNTTVNPMALGMMGLGGHVGLGMTSPDESVLNAGGMGGGTGAATLAMSPYSMYHRSHHLPAYSPHAPTMTHGQALHGQSPLSGVVPRQDGHGLGLDMGM